jgi:hypothetical protein
MVYYIATVKRGIRLHGWNTQTNFSLFPLCPSIIHNISHGFVGWFYSTGPSELGVHEGQSPPHFSAKLEGQSSPSKGFKLLFIYPLDFHTFLRSYCTFAQPYLLLSTIASAAAQCQYDVLVKNTVLCM